jgi:cyclic di-GMP phosphodiesterase
MSKKIPVEDLRQGMYIDKLDGNWLNHPFWKSSFKLEAIDDLESIKKAGITHVWINTSKGSDVKTTPKPTIDPSTETKKTKPEKVKKVELKEEMQAAKATLAKAKEATVNMFQEARMGNSVSVAEVGPLVDEISQSVARNPAAMLSITRLKNKDDYTYLHSVAVCALMIALGKQLNYKGDMHALGMAGLLHDVGKMGIPDEVLNKPGKLTDDEFELVKSHPKLGWEMLKESTDVIDDISLDVCLHHHERVDGFGYPDKLSGKKLSLVARMAAVCDVYDAITSDRCYKKGWEPAESLKKMAEWKDGHFDDDVFNAFVKTIGIYPTGTLIKLKSGRLGIVTDQSEQTLLKPKIKVFFSCGSQAPIPPKMLDLSKSQEEIESIEKPDTWGFDRQYIIDMISD